MASGKERLKSYLAGEQNRRFGIYLIGITRGENKQKARKYLKR